MENVVEAVWLQKNVDFRSLNEFCQNSRSGEGIPFSRWKVKKIKDILWAKLKSDIMMVIWEQENIHPNISVI